MSKFPSHDYSTPDWNRRGNVSARDTTLNVFSHLGGGSSRLKREQPNEVIDADVIGAGGRGEQGRQF
ncbi:MAG TPA: hypothetical protein VMU05_20540 [Dongiaceae bacterium]|nr:hypothetical protein [Dongiaceae bacterium]